MYIRCTQDVLNVHRTPMPILTPVLVLLQTDATYLTNDNHVGKTNRALWYTNILSFTYWLFHGCQHVSTRL